MTKYIFVTGGVVSSLGKGISASSLGRLLKNRGLKVTMQTLLMMVLKPTLIWVTTKELLMLEQVNILT